MTKLVILIPNGGTVHTEFFKSVIGLTQKLKSKNISFSIKTYEFSDLVMSRNYLVSYFLSQEEFTHALLLDSDIEFHSDQFFRLLDFDEDFCAAVYPNRRVTMPVLRDAIKGANEESSMDPRKLLSKSMRYIVTRSIGKKKGLESKTKGDFKTVASVGTGFMLIKRNVVEQIVANGQARPLSRTGRLDIYRDAPRFADFFSHHLTKEEDAFYGEDQSFCRRWILGCGGDIWVDCRSKVNHIGSFNFYGDYSHQNKDQLES